LLAQRDRGERIYVDDIPCRVAARGLGEDRAFRGSGAVLLDDDAGRFLEGFAVGGVIGGRGVAASVDEDEIARLREGAGNAERHRRRADQERRHLRESPAAYPALLRRAAKDLRVMGKEAIVHV